LVDGRTLTLVVVGGGLFALQSSNNLDVVKIAYLLVVAAATAVAAAGIPWWLSKERSPMTRPWIVATGSMVLVLAVSLLVSRAHGTQLSSWLRDAAPYALFALAPILALACARSASQRWLVAVLTICGSLASASFFVEWVGRRQLADLPFDRIVLPTGALASGLLALATALAIGAASRNWRWAAVAGIVLGLFFATGTRSTLLLLAVPIGIAVIAGRPRLAASRMVLAEVILAIAVFLVAGMGLSLANNAVQPSGTSGTSGTSAATATQPPLLGLDQRVGAVGNLVADPGSDQSMQERVAQTKVAWRAFTSSPLVGVGPGYTFRWVNSANLVDQTFSLDTPVVYLAKFGLLGLVPVALFAAAYLRLALALRRPKQARIEYLAVIGYLIVLGIASIQGSPVEDKGASFALILVLALGLQGLIHHDPADAGSGPKLPIEPATTT
jgi:hypothetical protein